MIRNGFLTFLLLCGMTCALAVAPPPSAMFYQGHLLLPLADLVQWAGGTVTPQPDNTISVARDKHLLMLTPGSRDAVADGVSFSLPCPFREQNGLVYAPSVVFSALGITVTRQPSEVDIEHPWRKTWMVVHIPDRSASYPNHAQKRWALAADALLSKANSGTNDRLDEGRSQNENTVTIIQTFLAKTGQITNRTDLLAKLQWLEEGGDRIAFETMGRRISAMSDAAYASFLQYLQQQPTELQQAKLIRGSYGQLGKAGLTGYDFSRYILLCRWGYDAHYLSEQEAWKLIMPAAIIIQHAYTSWKEIGENYLFGRELFCPELSRKDGNRFITLQHKLCTDKNSPWLNIPWNVKLE